MRKQEKKGFDYFEYFTKCAEHAKQAANCLHESLLNFDIEKFPSQVEAMHAIENSADVLKHQMMMALAREFLPPIEREDIVSLSHELDNVVDALDEIMQRIYMYNVQSIRPETLEFTALIIRCCDALADAAQELRNFKRSKTLPDKLVEVNTLEAEGDALLSKYTRKLFCEENSVLDIIIWTNLFEGLEMCFDKCERATDLMEGVILKNS
ncbi:MAG: DUF47 domain-containing protein [Christensenellales bacterium]|jgi:uncharacterized protein Yka (UPF0111/DUF47 family)